MHILSNGPHLVSPQEAQKVTKTQNEVTVEPYFWSLIDCHPVNPQLFWCFKRVIKSTQLENHFIVFIQTRTESGT